MPWSARRCVRYRRGFRIRGVGEARVNIDYHVLVDNHLYSVPYRLAHMQVDARLTGDMVEIFVDRARVASHRRSYVLGGFTTLREHMPSAQPGAGRVDARRGS
jgi:hypothetical protein